MNVISREMEWICHTGEDEGVAIGEDVTVSVTGLPPEGTPCTTSVKIVLVEVMKFVVASDSCGRDVEANIVV